MDKYIITYIGDDQPSSPEAGKEHEYKVISVNTVGLKSE